MTEGTRTLANRYLLEGAIGRGGMGIVHRARDRQLDRAVAIKLVSEAAEPAAKERFLVEARRTANVRHPSIVEVFDVGEDQGDAFLVMELLQGETLAERTARKGRVPAGDTIALASQICDALAAAHDAGLVHRDLKPANVFLVGEDSGGEARVKLLDFGIAKRIDGSTARTDPGMLVGTLEYMAPEQIRGERIDGRADLYALGMTMYRMLVGAPAFAGNNAASLVHGHLSVVPVSPRARVGGEDIPVALDALVMRLLEKEPDARLASARDVKRALAGEVMAAPATSRSAPATAPGSGLRAGRQMVELDDEQQPAPKIELELDRREAPAQHAPRLAQISHRMPEVGPAAAPLAIAGDPLPAFLEPLARVPFGISKRVTGYSLFVLAVYVVFFDAALVMSLLLLAVAIAGGVSMWASSRASR